MMSFSRTRFLFNSLRLMMGAGLGLAALPAMAELSVGYFDLDVGRGVSSQVPSIEAAGHVPVLLESLELSALSEVEVLYLQNPSNFEYALAIEQIDAIDQFARAGGVLVFHDRYVSAAASILPGGSQISFLRSVSDNLDVHPSVPDVVVDGPGGEIDNLTLDGGGWSTHGHAVADSLPASAIVSLTEASVDQAVTFSYPLGGGSIVYSAIPLDHYLANPDYRPNFYQIYAPNIVAYAASLSQDADGDGTLDGDDNCPDSANPDQADQDNDEIGDVCDSDRDGDDVDNDADAFPDDPTETIDSDSDGVGNNADNCPAVANRDQSDIDTDDIGDACDGDIDGDDVPNGEDAFPNDPAETVDTDNDGTGDNADTDDDNDDLPDQYEIDNGFDPLDAADADEDPDADDLNNRQEFNLGTEPNNADTDGDDMPDGYEALNGLDPLNDDADGDLDDDGISNIDEFNAGTNPNDAGSAPVASDDLIAFDQRLVAGWTESPEYLQAGDFDGDGDEDVAYLPDFPNVALWLENVDGQLVGPRTISLSTAFGGAASLSSRLIGVGDIQGDGQAELAIATANGVSLFTNTGGAEFDQLVLTDSVSEVNAVEFADIDGDGRSEVVVSAGTNGSISDVTAFAIASDSTVTSVTLASGSHQPGACEYFRSLSTTDLDSNGLPDFVVHCFGSPLEDSGVVWLRNLGSGTFQLLEIELDQAEVAFVDTADFDGDGDQDILRFDLSNSDGALVWYRNNYPQIDSFTRISIASGLPVSPNFGQGLPTIGDADGDGDQDFVVPLEEDAQLWRNSGNGSFSPEDIGLEFQRETMVTFAQVVSPGAQNLVVGINRNSQILVFDALTSAPGLVNHVVRSYQGSARGVSAGDLNGDGIQDIVVGTAFPPGFYRGGTRVALLAQLDNGESFEELLFPDPAKAGALATAIADLDRDGDSDIAAAWFSGAFGPDPVLGWQEQQDDGSFVYREIATLSRYVPNAIEVLDFDGDFDLDILATTTSSDRLDWFENNGSEIFTAHSIPIGLNDPSEAQVADLDGDDDLDLLLGSSTDDLVVWLENDGQGVFTSRSVEDTVNDLRSVRLADLDNDTLPDAVWTSFSDQSVYWAPNLGDVAAGDPQFGPTVIYASAVSARGGPLSLERGDINGDGLDDLVVATLDDRRWLQGRESGDVVSHLIETPSRTRTFSVLDLNGDGFSDILDQGPDALVMQLINRRVAVDDYGDAPVPMYPSAVILNGARHAVGSLFLGETVDAEFDAPADPNALGDDQNAELDDEDGITLARQMIAGDTVSLDIVASQPGLLDAWIDFNANGDWTDTDEQVAASLALVAGVNDLEVTIPSDATRGNTFGRFRLSSRGGLTPRGYAPDGEVEDHLIEILDPSARDRDADGRLDSNDNCPDVSNSDQADLDADEVGDVCDDDIDGDGAQNADDPDDDNDGLPDEYESANGLDPNNPGDADSDADEDGLNASEEFAASTDPNNADSDGDLMPDGYEADHGLDPTTDDADGDLDRDGVSNLDEFLAGTAPDDAGVYPVAAARPVFGQLPIQVALSGQAPFVADFDGDGDDDVMFSGKGLPFLENRDGQFELRALKPDQSFSFGNIAGSEVIDFDGDGDLDTLLLEDASGFSNRENRLLLLDNQYPAFAQTTLAVPSGPVRGFSLGDADGDGDGDVFVATRKSSDSLGGLYWFEREGAELVASHSIPHSSAADFLGAVATGDFDGDGNNDALAVSANRLIGFFGDGAGAFVESDLLQFSGFSSFSQMEAADFNGDGLPDLAINRPSAEEMVVLINMGSGAFQQAFSAGIRTDSFGLVAADLDGDGDLDITVSNSDTRSFTWFENDGGAGFTPTALAGISPEGRSFLAAGDINGDGIADVVGVGTAGGGNASRVVVGLEPAVTNTARRLHGATAEQSGFAAGDIDGDGDADFLPVSSRNAFTAYWYENTPTGFFEHPLQDANRLSETPRPAIGDIDSDGDADLIGYASAGSGSSLYVHRNNGNQIFTPSVVPLGTFISAPVFGDVDGDGDLDFVARGSGNTVRLFRNNGAGSFASQTIASSGNDPFRIVDVDQDGALDVLVRQADGTSGQRLRWLRNRGASSWQTRNVNSAFGGDDVDAGDFDQDGDIDIVAVKDGFIAWFENDGDNAFSQREILRDEDDASSVGVADLDGDGDLDLAIGRPSFSGNVSWFQNDGTGGFEPILAASVSQSNRVEIVDVNLDGKPDIVSSDFSLNSLTWLQNGEADFGDMPRSSQARLPSGARHRISSLYLGSGVDAEADGLPSPEADGDDNNESDDEDGVSWDQFRSGEITTLTLAPSQSGYVSVFVDFNHDGDVSDSSDIALTDVAVAAASSVQLPTVTFRVPVETEPGRVAMRVRISSSGTPTAFGWAPDGEVEDYLVSISIPDIDSDGVLDEADNCPQTPNADQANADGDTAGDVCDAFPNDPTETSDRDGDGVGDNGDDLPDDPTETVDTDGDGTGNNADTDDDGDRIPDSYEANNGLDPLDASDATADADGDGLTNRQEFQRGTDVNDADTDGDGIQDDVDDEPLVFSNACGSTDEEFGNDTVRDGESQTCATEMPLMVDDTLVLEPGGRVTVIAPEITVDPNFRVPEGAVFRMIVRPPPG